MSARPTPAWSLPSGEAPAIEGPGREAHTRDWAIGGSRGAVDVCIVDSGVEAGHPLVGTRLEVVPKRRVREADPDDHQVPILERRAGGQVMGGRVHGDQPLGAVQEQGASQDREQDKAGAERRAAVHPGGRAQAVGWGRRWRRVQAGQSRGSVGDGAASAEDA